MIGLSVDARQVIDAFTKTPEKVLLEVEAALDTSATLLMEEARRLAPQAEGDLKSGIEAIKLSPLNWIVESGRQDGARPYAVFVETGIRAGLNQQLPDKGLAAIGAWIKRRGIVPRQGDRSLLNKTRQRIDAKEELVWLIGRTIARRGIKPRPYMQPAFDSQKAAVLARITAGVEIGLKEAGLA